MKKLAILIAISACAFAGWRVLGGGGDDTAATDVAAHDGKLTLGRVWVDHMPTNDRDTVSVFIAIADEPVGLFQSASMWKGAYEVFRYEAHGHELRLVFPQTGDREKVRAKARKCDERGFDYCLELDGSSRGVKRYYSREGWEIEGAAGPAALRDRVEALLQAP